jgi:hypothetical protein
MDYGPGLIRDYLLSELQAYGLVTREGEVFVYHGERNDYMVEMTLFKIDKDNPTQVRLRETDFYPPYLVD